VVPVSDLVSATAWYDRLLGRPPDNRPMDTLVEWRITDSAWLQVTNGWGEPGTALVNFAVDDLSEHLDGMRSRGLDPGPVQNVTNGVQLSAIVDPDGNTITLIGHFRVTY
jgi:catechol 2,3-dioxygenase-like lactoylglutathione lyase family enzyme